MDFDSASSELPLSELSQRIAHGAVDMPWPERRDLVGRAVTVLRSSTDRVHASKLLAQLARDTKWEVRKAVADNLLHAVDAILSGQVP